MFSVLLYFWLRVSRVFWVWHISRISLLIQFSDSADELFCHELNKMGVSKQNASLINRKYNLGVVEQQTKLFYLGSVIEFFK